MGNEVKLRLQFAVVVVFFIWNFLIPPRLFLGRNFFFKYFMVHCAITIIQYCWKENKNRYMIRSNGGPWKISFQKKKHHRRTLFNTSFYFILHQSLQYHLNSMFHFSLGPMFLSAFLRDWGVISFDILTVTVMTTGSWLVLWARYWNLLCH